ncbi:uncharacterized protein LOC104438120 isoform X5 [Eucalyptus grandis]|uniref:uncharacterized protein LOC104438120 isoform X5 n=1 Tax=Eucalyptus grandis TaxID=71139 RepID=UPI00192E9809|nr:uncharacterized protein LOC104438120 isoform X5 [Eucalyptus grandis]
MDIPSGVLTLPPPPVANEEGNSEGTRTDKVIPIKVIHPGLLEVAMTGHWTSVQQEVSHDSKSVMAEVMTVEDGPVTVLEAAVIGTHDHLVENLVELLPPRKENLNLKRALCNAARGGRIRMVKALISKIEFESESLALALLTAISWAPIQKEVIWYLARKISSRHDDTISKHDDIISSLTLAGHMVSFIKRIVESKLRQEFGNLALLNKIFTMDIPKIREFLLTSNIVIDAASRGISDFVQLCLMFFPELMWEKNFTKELIKEVVKGRHVELFRRLSAHNTTPYLTDDELTRRSLMEAVVEWSPRCVSADVSGAAFLIQRELQWFKVVEDMSDPSLKRLKFKVSKEEDGSDPSFKSLKLEETKERRGKTYWEVFVEQRQDLLKEAGQWMKDTSSSCSLISTLIITVAFAAAFTAPGGNDDDGIPIFLKKSSFIVFAIADALALFSSVTATLMFLAILTSRYAIEDFVHSLPRKMILGLTFLFLSLAFMMVAFGSALTMVLNQRLEWIYIPITLFAAIPIILFALLQLPLYVEMFESTGWPPLYRPIKIWK